MLLSNRFHYYSMGGKSSKSAPSHGRDLGLHLIHGSLGPHESTCQTPTCSSLQFFHRQRFMVPILYYGSVPSAPKTALYRGGPRPPSNMWLLGPTLAYKPNCTSIGSAVFAGLTNVTDTLTDRHTDHATTGVAIGCIYAMHTMQPNKFTVTCKQMKQVLTNRICGHFHSQQRVKCLLGYECQV